MSLEAVLASPGEPGGDALVAASLWRLLRTEFLRELGWDDEQRLARPSPNHPLLGYRRVCEVINCDSPAWGHGGPALCSVCQARWRTRGGPVEEFVATTTRSYTVGGFGVCQVPGCGRAQQSFTNPICLSHRRQKDHLGISAIAEFVVHPSVRPKPPLEPCPVIACHRQRADEIRCCRGHNHRWREERKKDPALDFDEWCATTGMIAHATLVSLRGLPDRVVAEILYGTQQRIAEHTQLDPRLLRRICDQARARRVGCLDALILAAAPATRTIVRGMVQSCQRALITPELEALKDVWDARVFGLGRRTFGFTRVRQEWLRSAAKAWVLEEIPRHYGKDIPNALMSMVNALARLSDSLYLHRDDHGENPATLRRADIEAFQQRLAYLEHTGQISPTLRITICRWCARFLRDIRDMGMTRPAQQLSGLGDDFVFRRSDIPRKPSLDSAGRALPREVLAQLCERLPLVETLRRVSRRGEADPGRPIRIALEVLIDTGRRPDEIQKLVWDCLETDESGKYALVYADFKNNRRGCRVPIPDSTAALITEQKNRVQAAYPNTPISELVLFPNPHFNNPDGTKPYAEFLGDAHRDWLGAMPPLVRADGTEYPKNTITPYSYRHSYAQRHADAGTPVDVLRQLMGHRSLNTTQGYYRVSETRTRQAVDSLTAHQFDRHGARVWDEAKALLEHEHTRMRIGQVAVPFGICVEPSNVQAGGHACPFRFRCLGCDHFRTDPSYLPELRAYLDTLLRNRERLAAASELDEWARVEATPSPEELSRLRGLIRRVETDLEALNEPDRERITEATATLRKTRAVGLGMPGARPPAPNLRLDRDA